MFYHTDVYLNFFVERFKIISQVLTLPERQKDDGLDGEELEYWIEGLEHFPGGAEEEEETVEGETDREVVHDGDVQIAAVGTPVAIMVMSGGLEKEKLKPH